MFTCILHHDGYPEWRGIELANWIIFMQETKGYTQFNDGSKNSITFST